jgi:hypothetical protein
MHEGSLQLHPEIQRLSDENALLREELARLLTEVEDLVHTTKPNLLALYQTKLGRWELAALQAQAAVARLRRQVELAQTSLNRGEQPDPVAIECALELEFLTWQTKLKEAAERLQTAEARLQNLLSPADDHELKKLYYALVKRLHPDLNPNLTDDQRRLWQRLQSAYQASDLPELRALALLAEDAAALPPPPKPLETLRQDQATLRAQITVLLQRVEQIESQPPFTLRAQLDDEAWLAARRQASETQTAALRQQADALQAHWQTLVGGTGHGTIAGNN